MFSSLVNFSRKHKRKILITGGLVGLGYLAIEYVKRKILEIQDRIAEEKFTREQ